MALKFNSTHAAAAWTPAAGDDSALFRYSSVRFGPQDREANHARTHYDSPVHVVNTPVLGTM